MAAKAITHRNTGTCSKSVEFQMEGDAIYGVSFQGGCDGNLKGIAALVEGMDTREVVSRLEGMTCGKKSTSCPDQLAKAIKEALGDDWG